MKRLAALASLIVLIAMSLSMADRPLLAQDPAGTGGEANKNDPKRVVKTDEEWQKLLPRKSYLVTRLKQTEPAFSGTYARYHSKIGRFACICCGTELFDAKNKFESGTGWPSFYRPIAAQRIATANDYSEVEPRVEVMCSVCDAHLGHVFSDGPPPTGLRYCINSASLKLVKPAVVDPKAKAKTPAKGKTAKAGTAKPAADERPKPDKGPG